MPGLIEQILSLATIEQIDAEQLELRSAIADRQKQLDALEQVRRILIVARDGKPAKTWSRKRGASRTDRDPAPGGDDPESTGTLTVGEISHRIKVVYSTAYSATQKLLDQNLIVKSGDKLAVKV